MASLFCYSYKLEDYGHKSDYTNYADAFDRLAKWFAKSGTDNQDIHVVIFLHYFSNTF